MIYVCVPTRDEAATVGVLLWKIRRVFEEFPREYHLLVADDGSTDGTAEVLEPYTKVLPLTLLPSGQHLGYAATVERLLRHALAQTDRPKRDAAILLHADFTHDAAALPEFVRALESGADLVVGEATLAGEPDRRRRLVRRWAPLLVRRRVAVAAVRDVVSGFVGLRLVTLRHALRDADDRLLHTEGPAANAELIGRMARQARRVQPVAVTERHDLRQRAHRSGPWSLARELWRARGALQLPAATPRRKRGSEAEPAEAA